MPPLAAPRPCRRSGCPKLVAGSDGYCEEHRRELWRADTRRRKDELQFYGTAAWKRLRAAILRKEPLCRTCREQGKLTPATAVDHIVRVKAGGNRFDTSNLAPICNECHAIKRSREAHDAREAREAASNQPPGPRKFGGFG